MVKKVGLMFCAIFLAFSISISLISAVEVTPSAVSSLAIKDLNKPAIFDLTFKNNGNADIFNIYSTIGLKIEPNESFNLAAGEEKTIQIKVYPSLPLKISPDYMSFEYKIKDSSNNIQVEELAMTIANLKDALEFTIDPINPDSETALVHINSKYGNSIGNLNLEFSSVFFSQTAEFSLAPFEKKEIQIPLNKDKIKELFAGPYIVNAKINSADVSAETSTILKFEEKAGIDTTQSSE